jgi:hypothetical protein
MAKDKEPELTPSENIPWFKKKKIIIPLILLVVVIGASSSGSSKDSADSDKTTPSASSEKADEPVAEEPVKEEPAGGEYGNYPAAQAKFIKVIEVAKDKIDAAETDLQESVALRTRDKDLCAILGNYTATNWTGVIDNVGANGEGKAYVEIKLADNVKVKTWNNAFSDSGDGTLIPETSKFFNSLVALKKGDLVTFSATFLRGDNFCLKKANLTQTFYAIDPGFIVRFTNVSKA